MVSASQTKSAGEALCYYYSKDPVAGEKNGEWLGKTAKALGLQGDVSKEDFTAVLCGVDPRTGETLIEYKGTKEEGKDKLDHRAGVEITFSPDKSFSIACLADSNLRDLHRQAVLNALKLGEKEFACTRQTINGETKIVETGSLIAARFEHWTNRENEVNVHDHVFIANVTQRSDGKFRALDTTKLYQLQRFIGRAYDTELLRLTKEAGYQVEITDRENSNWRLSAIPKELAAANFTRMAQIEALNADWKANGMYADLSEAEINQKANLMTRAAKDSSITKDELDAKWDAKLAEHGETRESLKEKLEAGKEKAQDITPQRSPEAALEKAADVLQGGQR